MQRSIWTCRACARSLFLQGRRKYSGQDGPRDYNAAVAALNSLQSNFSIVEAVRKLGPSANASAIPQMIEWVRRIGYEPTDFDGLNPIHIAGTKGKGSTSAFVSSILAQYLPTKKSIPAERLPSSVGLYTSPHLRFVRERIKIDDRPISEERFAEVFWTIWDRFKATSPSETSPGVKRSLDMPVYFHYLTLMALHCYLEDKVGTAVIECGIGGEYDTTNILVRPSVTGVTSLGIDHQGMLGDTIESIAWHKAGIFKPNVPAFSVPQPGKANEVLEQRAGERGAHLRFVQQHPLMDSIKLGLEGEFQKLNASLAVSIAAAHLSRLGYSNLPDPDQSFAELPPEFLTGLESARLGGRCDRRPDIKSENLTWFIDGGHTLESIEVAGKWFASAADQTQNEEPKRILVFNQQTRDASALARRLHETLAKALKDGSPFQHAIFCPNVTYKDAGYKADLVSINTNKDDVDSLRVQRELAVSWDRLDSKAEVHVVSTIEEAVAKVRSIAESQCTDVLATGSLHLVGGLIEVLESEAESR